MTFETNDNYSIRFEMKKHYSHSTMLDNQVPKQDIVLVNGDFNAKIGKGAPIGKFALGDRNDNGDN